MLRPLAAPILAAFALAFAGCFVANAPARGNDAHVAPSSDSEDGRRALAERAASNDLACAEAHVVATVDRRYANSTSVRYVVEGCGRRALYVEDCAQPDACRYLLVSLVSLSPRAPEPPATRDAR